MWARSRSDLACPVPSLAPFQPLFRRSLGEGSSARGGRSWGPTGGAALLLPVPVGAVGYACDHRALQMLNTSTIAGLAGSLSLHVKSELPHDQVRSHLLMGLHEICYLDILRGLARNLQTCERGRVEF